MIDLGDWNERLAPLFADERYLKIRNFLIDEYKNHTVFPDKYDLYNCFRFTPFRISQTQLDSIHGINENVDIAALAPAVKFYQYMMTEV